MFKKMNLFSRSGTRLLRLLARNPSKSMYEREISKEAGVSVGSTNQHLREFAKQGIVHVEQKGRMNFYCINLDNPVVRQLKITFNTLELEPLVERIKDHSTRITLFGSCAEGTDTEDSDVDLLILAKEKEKVRAEVSKFSPKIERKVSAIIVNTDEFMKLKKEDKPLYERISRGIDLWNS
ncbi:MAG: winged helix-turn-helix transcriptional regulator [Candidatus Altiarchaeales archaeon]|nr:winged helix-turn-helix transcriptional regulator [Candidatus Altiarchaeales archaeon]